jgi:hypothetical protein
LVPTQDSEPREQSMEGAINVVQLRDTSGIVKSPGVMIDSLLSFDEHVDSICKPTYHHIRALCHLRTCITDDDTKQIRVSMVSARLDYCNSVIYGTSQSNFAKLQHIHKTLTHAYHNHLYQQLRSHYADISRSSLTDGRHPH